MKNEILWSGEAEIVPFLKRRVWRTPGVAHHLGYSLPVVQPGPAGSLMLWGWRRLMEQRYTDGTPDPEPQVNVLEWPSQRPDLNPDISHTQIFPMHISPSSRFFF